jgi:ribosomal protein L37E
MPDRGPEAPEGSLDQGVCGVCLHPLDAVATSCEMCGAPRLSRPEEATAVRCPRCASEIRKDATACRECGFDFLAPAPVAELRLRCPVCTAEAATDAESCPSCATALFAPPGKEAPPPAAVKCPSCGRAATEDEEECAQCGHALWHLRPEAWEALVKDRLDDARLELELTEREAWIDLAAARSLYESALSALGDKRFPQALRTADTAARSAQGSRVQALMFLDAYRSAVARNTIAQETGADTEGCDALLRLAGDARARREYRQAVQLAIRSRLCAEDAVASRSRARPSA